MWLTFMIVEDNSNSDDLQSGNIARKLLKLAFFSTPEIEYFLFLCQEGLELYRSLTELFIPLNGANEMRKDVGGFDHVTVYCCHRSGFLPRLIIRKAMVEDHDDLGWWKSLYFYQG